MYDFQLVRQSIYYVEAKDLLLFEKQCDLSLHLSVYKTQNIIKIQFVTKIHCVFHESEWLIDAFRETAQGDRSCLMCLMKTNLKKKLKRIRSGTNFPVKMLIAKNRELNNNKFQIRSVSALPAINFASCIKNKLDK